MANITSKIQQTFKYPNIAASYGPYQSKHAAHLALADDGLNIIGMTVGIEDSTTHTIKEWWYQGGTTEADLVEKSKHPYISLERLRQYLYRVTFDKLPADNGGDNPVSGGCSSFVQNGKLYRNLDFKYDNAASFIVRTKDFDGMSFVTGLNDGQMDDTLIAQLPYRIVDGVNNNGIKVSTHVLFNDWEYTGAGDKSIPLTRLPYLVLTMVKSMDTIATDLADVLGNLEVTASMGDYLLQCLVTDGTTTYAIVPPASDNQSYTLVEATSYPKMTNFLYVARAEVSRQDMDLQDRPTGIERFNAMPCDLEDLRFTKAYENTDRLSEFIGIDGTTKTSTDEELTAIYEEARAEYLVRQRDGKTWQTMHSIVYGHKMEQLYIQENWEDNVLLTGSETAVLYTSQTLTEEQKQQARENIGIESPMVETTYTALKVLRDGGNLVPGTWYRITDYTCTTTQNDTQSAGHVFDIIVRADDASHLNENAYAAHHEGDTYFQDCKLEAWELKYCIDNDNTRFAWADEDGKGVIFFMKDEWNNQCPYDFKNIMFKRYLVTDYDSELGEILDNSDWTPSKYIAFDGMDNAHVQEYDESDFIFLYTFTTNSYDDTDAILDASLNTKNGNNDSDGYYVQFCYDNNIELSMAGQEIDGQYKTIARLNNIVFSDRNELFEEGNEPTKIYGNVFGCNCHDMMFESHNYCNSFKANCYNNLFFKSYYNIFGNLCYSNTFGNECYSNTFGNSCRNNTFGNYCKDNTFGNECYSNTFGNDCKDNTFGNECYSNTFGNYFQYNTFGNDCSGNTFGNDCQKITSFDGVQYCSVTGGTTNAPVKNAQILNGTAGASSSNKLTISFAANKSYTQFAGKNTSGTLKIFNPADNV